MHDGWEGECSPSLLAEGIDFQLSLLEALAEQTAGSYPPTQACLVCYSLVSDCVCFDGPELAPLPNVIIQLKADLQLA